MKRTTKWMLSLLLLSCTFSYAQLKNYNYERALIGVEDTWHKVVLPSEIFTHINNPLSEVRIFGITEKQDTIEAPYVLQLKTDEITRKEISFKIINRVSNANGHYFTFELPTSETITEIDVDFAEENFDWKIQLEGSLDQKEWFSVLKDYRILSINNGQTNFEFTKLKFPPIKYKYFRLRVQDEKKPDLLNAQITLNELALGTFEKFNILKTATEENKPLKRTEIEVHLERPVPVSKMTINIKDDYDYYRPFTIQYLTDSIQTEKGWKYNYSTLTSGTLNSIEKSDYTFGSTITQKLKILIENKDNQPLTITNIEVKGHQYALIARFTAPASYVLAYGNKLANRPQYDIGRFSNKLPENISALKLGAEKSNLKEKVKSGALFENKIWLWVIMGVIILLLGGFSLKMLRKG